MFSPRSSRSDAGIVSAAGLLLLTLVSCTRSTAPAPASRTATLTIYVLGSDADTLRGAQLAADAVTAMRHGYRLAIKVAALNAAGLAAISDDEDVLAAITIGGEAIIQSASRAIQTNHLPVFEMNDDLYSTSLSPTAFQSPIPLEWQAWRLARYFGPDDRGYTLVGLAVEPSQRAASVQRVLSDALSLRGVRLVASAAEPEAAIQALAGALPSAVVVSGSDGYRRSVLALLDAGHAYRGRSQITQGWRPQVAGFAELLRDSPTRGSVAVGDYARAAWGKVPVESARGFANAFSKRYHRPPSADEVRGYDIVRLVDFVARGAARTDDLINALEKVDRKRFGSLPISLGPLDHVLPERDHLGLWTREDGEWEPLMRTFTSDLERTDVLEEDWSAFFPGADPAGEAPFFRDAKLGVTSERSDDMH